jgi:hypothetical protein
LQQIHIGERTLYEIHRTKWDAYLAESASEKTKASGSA